MKLIQIEQARAELVADIAAVQTAADTAAEEATEVAKHFHVRERWLGAAAAQGMTPYQLDAGNDDYGANGTNDTWLEVLAVGDTPVIATMTKFDLHRIAISAVETEAAVTRIRFSWGATGDAGLQAGNYTEFVIIPVSADGGPPVAAVQGPVGVLMPRLAAGTLVWAQAWVKGANTSTIDFFIGIHEYLV